jgi:uncharacterized membrane protein YdbT with pleckstrin-like domain
LPRWRSRCSLPYSESVRDQSEEVFFHGHPSWRATLDLYAKGVTGAVAAGAVAGVVTAIVAGHVEVGWVIVVVAAVLAGVLVAGLVARTRTTYTITSERLTIQRGLLSHELHETRLERVQNVNTRQSMVERLLRVGTVDFDTAGGADYDFAFRGVAEPKQIVRTVHEALKKADQLSRLDASRIP